MEDDKKEGTEPSEGGRPTIYKPEFCEMLINHMRSGNSFESFGALVPCSKRTCWGWLKTHPEFFQAKKIGEPLLAKYYEDMGKMIAMGQLKRVVSEKPALDFNGKPILDAHGNVVMEREYAPAVANSTAWIFLCKNMLGWRDKRDIAISTPENPGAPTLPPGMTKEQMEERAAAIVAAVMNRVKGSNEKPVTGTRAVPAAGRTGRTRDLPPGN